MTSHDPVCGRELTALLTFKSALKGASLIVYTASTARGHYEIAFTTNGDPRR
jgi:hypothetical protein